MTVPIRADTPPDTIPGRTWRALAVLLASMFMALLDTTTVGRG